MDLPAIRKLYSRWAYRGIVRDTLITTRLIWPKDPLREMDLEFWKRDKLPGNRIGRYSLQAWAYRLMDDKGDHSGARGTWNHDTQVYCAQDVAVRRTAKSVREGKRDEVLREPRVPHGL